MFSLTTPILVLLQLSCAAAFVQQQDVLPKRIITRRQASSFFDGLFKRQEADVWRPSESSSNDQTTDAARLFIQSLNEGDVSGALSVVSDDCTVDFAEFAEPCNGKEPLERRLRLLANSKAPADREIVAIDRIIADDKRNTVAVKFHLENNGVDAVVRGSAFFTMVDGGQLIQEILMIKEQSLKAGEKSLNLLRQASKVIEITGVGSERVVVDADTQTMTKSNLAPLNYFAAWNRRDMEAAVEQFAGDASYDDTAFPDTFVGKDALRKHLLVCADCFPPSFSFEVDDFVDGGDAVCVKWHVENNGEQLPFTRGCSFYEISREGLIQDGIDFLEQTVIKPGAASLLVDSIRTQISEEPARVVPLTIWIAYMVIVFFSDGILPGANALQLEARTWEEVRDLSLNFFLVSPILNLPFSPTVHPMLEGVFNLLLSWAAMFAGFLSDDRRDKPNVFPMFPAVIGMQFLTSAFLLPYLATRSTETRSDVVESELPVVARACESPLLGILMGAVGSASIAWGFLGRREEFGYVFTERYSSFVDLLSIDRVGSSFLVDLVIFGLFQFWLVDDDLKRRGVEETNAPLALAAKFVPFFGMAFYMMFRPRFPEPE